jgi:transcriptional regulator with XRE-family HTH domain
MEINPAASAAEQYAYRMRLYRERADLTQDDVGVKCNISGKMIGHFENCRRIPTMDVSKALDRLFELDQYFEELHPHVVREAALPSGYLDYAEREEQASYIRVYEALFVPGLLQSEAYAREVLRAGQTDVRLERVVAVRMGRQDILQREEPPVLVVLMKEAVLREVVGGSELMKDQLANLLEAMRRPNISVQVIPCGAAVYVSSGFTLLGYAEGADLAFVDGAGGHGRVIEPTDQVQALAILFDQIRSEALSASESEKLIRAIMEEL